jgi:hypothetical protein
MRRTDGGRRARSPPAVVILAARLLKRRERGANVNSWRPNMGLSPAARQIEEVALLSSSR